MRGSRDAMVPDEEDREFMKMVDRAGYLAIAKGNLHEAQNCLDMAESIMTVDMDGPEYADLSHQFKIIGGRIWELEKRAEGMQNTLTWDIAWRANPPEGEE